LGRGGNSKQEKKFEKIPTHREIQPWKICFNWGSGEFFEHKDAPDKV
jgi:hypothetical protein